MYIHSDMLSVIYSGILSGILSGIYSDILPASTLAFYLAVFRHSFLHSLWHVFGSRRGPLHPELVIWLTTIETHSHDKLQEEHTRSKGEVGGGVGGRRRRREK